MVEVEVSGARHCAVASCHQLDFLPFRCDACGQHFCQNHFAHASHNCPRAENSSVQVLLCPLCHEAIRIKPDEDPNLTWERHFTQSCRQSVKEKKGPKRCPVPGCKEQLGLSNKFECQRCGTTVCLRHRMQEDHPCRKTSSASTGVRARSAPPPRPAPQAREGSAVRAPPASASHSAPPHQMTEDEMLARMMQEQEIFEAQAMAGHGFDDEDARRRPAPPQPGKKPKKKLTQRIASMFACFKSKTSTPTQRLLGSGSSSSGR